MVFWLRKGEKSVGLLEAEAALAEAEQRVETNQMLAQELREIREENHLAEAIFNAMVRQRSV